MSQKHTLNSFLLAVVLAGAVFAVALMLFLFLADYRLMASLFLAFFVALLAGIVLFLGFGSPVQQPALVVARAPEPAPAPAPEPVTAPEPTPAPAPSAAPAAAAAPEPTPEDDAVAQKAAAFQEEAARMKAAEEAAAAAEAEAQRKREEEEAAAAAEAKATAEATPDFDGDGKLEGTDEGARPSGLDAARDGKADNLKEIKGIGPKLEKLCNSLGFWHFDQIAAWTSDEVAWVDANLEGFKGRVTRDKWVEQAKILSEGGETEFSKRVEDGDVY